MPHLKLSQYINTFWESQIIPTLKEYITIPNKSPQFDPDWEKNGHMEQAIQLISHWCQQHAIDHMKLDIVRLPHRTPIIFIDIPGTTDDTILLYGHLDKQPEMTGWDQDLHPWRAVLKNNRLYGRGSADDGYAAFASLTAIKALREHNIPHARCIILIEACEESGSYDLPFYIDALKERIGTPSLVICLDSGCGNYEQLWMTTSLRGVLTATLNIQVLTEGIHSGAGSGIVPSCTRILRQLLNRVEDEKTGDIILKELQVDIPPHRIQQANKTAKVLGEQFIHDLPFINQTEPESHHINELILRRTWKASLSLVGCDGLPPIKQAGNVTLPSLSVKLSFRLPPTCAAEQASNTLKILFESNPPYQAHIEFVPDAAGPGWNAPNEAPWLTDACNQASLTYFGKEAMYMGEGGSIPFMGMLGKKFPHAQFVITGVLGPHSNAHGPNEFLDIPMAKKLTACISYIIAKHIKRENRLLEKTKI